MIFSIIFVPQISDNLIDFICRERGDGVTVRINVGIRGDFTMGKINVDAQIAGELG